jgi:hypothetical protein
MRYAQTPYLGRVADVDLSTRSLDPVASEHVELERLDPFGRDWWLRELGAALQQSNPLTTPTTVDETRRALTIHSPEVLLAEFLRQYHNLQLAYERPAILDKVEELQETADPSAADAGVTDIRRRKLDPAFDRMSRRRV